MRILRVCLIGIPVFVLARHGRANTAEFEFTRLSVPERHRQPDGAETGAFVFPALLLTLRNGGYYVRKLYGSGKKNGAAGS